MSTGDESRCHHISRRIDAASDLPRLVRRLLAATAPLAMVEMRGVVGSLAVVPRVEDVDRGSLLAIPPRERTLVRGLVQRMAVLMGS